MKIFGENYGALELNLKLNYESKKILVLGSPGAGKTFFSNDLSKKIGIETIHLDDYYWLEGWKHLNADEWKNLLIMLMERDSYIMDGNYIESLDLRIGYVDTIIYRLFFIEFNKRDN